MVVGEGWQTICHMDGQGAWSLNKNVVELYLSRSLPLPHWRIKPSGQYCLPPTPSLVYIFLYLCKLNLVFLCSVLLHKDLLEEVILLSLVKKEQNVGRICWEDGVRISRKFLLEILREFPGGPVVRTPSFHC